MTEVFNKYGAGMAASGGAASRTREGIEAVKKAAQDAIGYMNSLASAGGFAWEYLAREPYRIQEAWSAQKLALMDIEETLKGTISEQIQALKGLGGSMNVIEGQASQAFGSMLNGAQDALPSVEELRERFSYLDESDLSGIISQVESLRQEVENAKASLDDMADSLRDELDRMAGNETAIEQRRYEEQVQRIKDLAQMSGKDAQEELDLARRVHEEKMANLNKEAEARKAARQKEEREASQPPPPPPPRPSRNEPSAEPPIPRAQTTTQQPTSRTGAQATYITIQKMDVFPADVSSFIDQLREQARRQ
jgi:hypothetical protein